MSNELSPQQIVRFFILSSMFFFIVGSLFGWVFELFFRRFLTAKRWLNPGFFKGPYLPIYGFGGVLLFNLGMLRYINPIPPSVPGNDLIWDVAVILLIISSALAMELITGLVFIKHLHIQLWNYTKAKANYKGIICPRFILLWSLLTVVFYFLLFDPLLKAAIWCHDKDYMIFIFGLFSGILLADSIYSFSTRIKKQKESS